MFPQPRHPLTSHQVERRHANSSRELHDGPPSSRSSAASRSGRSASRGAAASETTASFAALSIPPPSTPAVTSPASVSGGDEASKRSIAIIDSASALEAPGRHTPSSPQCSVRRQSLELAQTARQDDATARLPVGHATWRAARRHDESAASEMTSATAHWVGPGYLARRVTAPSSALGARLLLRRDAPDSRRPGADAKLRNSRRGCGFSSRLGSIGRSR
jgi:hypothetical protein